MPLGVQEKRPPEVSSFSPLLTNGCDCLTKARSPRMGCWCTCGSSRPSFPSCPSHPPAPAARMQPATPTTRKGRRPTGRRALR